MGVVSKPTTFVDGTVPTAAQFNGDFDTIYNEFNGNITNSNISASAAIAESKIAFNTSTGHSHNGTDSKLITTRASYLGFIAGTLAVANDLATNPRVRAAATATRLSAYVKTAPTGADLILRVWNVTQGATVTSVTIPASSTSATTTTITNASLTAGDFLRFDITQVGSSVAGVSATIQLDCTE